MSPRRDGFYAVNKGRTPGVYTSWAQCALQVNGFSGAVYKRFATEAEAEQFVAVGRDDPATIISVSAVQVAYSPKRVIVIESGEWDTVQCEAYQTEDGSVGVGVWWGENDPKNVSERCPGIEGLERGELVAVARALENAPPGNMSLLVKTTSLRCISHIHKCVQIMKAEAQAEGITLLNMPLSIYLPRLLARIRRQGRRIKLKHLDQGSVVEEPGVQEARSLAVLGSRRESGKRVWALQEDNSNVLDLITTSMASLEIEV